MPRVYPERHECEVTRLDVIPESLIAEPISFEVSAQGARNKESLECQRRGRFSHTLPVAWRGAKYRERHRALRGWVLACKWCTAFRIAHGHIEFERARDYALNRIGPASRALPSGCLVPHERTEAGSSDIRTEEATFGDWLPQFDRQIFLMGFDAGADFVLRTSSTGYIDAYLGTTHHKLKNPQRANVSAVRCILHAIATIIYG